jgi:hypothetical protein
MQLQTATSAPNHVSTSARGEIQAFGTVNHALPLDLEDSLRLEMTEQLNQLLADTIIFVICTKSLTGRLPAPPSFTS